MQTMTKRYAMKRGHKRKQKAISGHLSPGILTLNGKLLYSIMPLLHRDTFCTHRSQTPSNQSYFTELPAHAQQRSVGGMLEHKRGDENKSRKNKHEW